MNYAAAPKNAPYGVGYWRAENYVVIVQVLAHSEPDVESAI